MSEWPPFLVTFVAKGGIDGIHALRRVLKFALRECGLRCVDAYPIFDAMSPDLPAQIAQYDGRRKALDNAREAARRCLRSNLLLSTNEHCFLNDMARLTAPPQHRVSAIGCATSMREQSE
jgi:hypothetical protein